MGVYVPVIDIAGKAARADSLQSTDANPPVIKNNSGVEIGQTCRAWINFNGVTGSVANRQSFNVSSLTRNTTGDYTIAFTNALPDANYVPIFGCVGRVATDSLQSVCVKGTNTTGASNKTTGQISIVSGDSHQSTARDLAEINMAIFR